MDMIRHASHTRPSLLWIHAKDAEKDDEDEATKRAAVELKEDVGMDTASNLNMTNLERTITGGTITNSGHVTLN